MSTTTPWSVVMDRAVARQSHRNLFGIDAAIEENYRNMEQPEETGLLLHSLDSSFPGESTLHVEVDLKRPWDYGKGMNDGIVGNADGGETIVPVLAKVLRWVDLVTGEEVFRRSVKAGRKHLHWWDIWRETVVPDLIRDAWRGVGPEPTEAP